MLEMATRGYFTISEVAEDLVLPQHVLRFWETRFPQIRPLKRAGGRRYYRPTDVVVLRSIRQLLYDEGYTIKGVQRLLKEQGARGLRVSEPTLAAATVREAEAELGDEPERDLLNRDKSAETPGVSGSRGEGALREALACVEECERILERLRRPGK